MRSVAEASAEEHDPQQQEWNAGAGRNNEDDGAGDLHGIARTCHQPPVGGNGHEPADERAAANGQSVASPIAKPAHWAPSQVQATRRSARSGRSGRTVPKVIPADRVKNSKSRPAAHPATACADGNVTEGRRLPAIAVRRQAHCLRRPGQHAGRRETTGVRTTARPIERRRDREPEVAIAATQRGEKMMPPMLPPL